MTRRLHARHHRRAFTLIESMATVTILAITGSLASFLILEAVDSYTDAGNSAQLHTELSIALDRCTREIRAIPLATGGGIAPDIDGVTATSMDWKDADSEAYSLSYNSTDHEVLLAVDGGAAAVLLSDVTSFAVTTYDQDDDPQASTLTGAQCDPVRRVLLEVTVERSGVSESLRAKTFIRSTMSFVD